MEPIPSETKPSPEDETAATPRGRVDSVDAYRGLVMFLMMAEVLRLGRVARSFPESPFWQALAFHQSHVEWAGCSAHDMIQPSFSFLVGVALPFSLASRARRCEPSWRTDAHAIWRALVLVTLGIFLRSVGGKQTNYTFEDTLTQIGLGYVPLYLIARCRPIWHRVALGVVLLGIWLAFVAYPAPGPGHDFAAVGVPADWPHHPSGRLAGHFDKNSNLFWAFDRWFLNLFPREKPFTHNGGGYSTLSFVPTLGTMILGLIAGSRLMAPGAGWRKVGWLLAAGFAATGSAWLVERLGLCPIVKRIWTPSWVLFSGGIALGTLGVLYAIVDDLGWRSWTYPLRVIGRNSIAAYLIAHLAEDFFRESYRTHLGREPFRVFGAEYEPLASGAAVLLSSWMVLFWMDRRGIYLRV